MNATKTGRIVDVYGLKLPEAKTSEPVGYPDVVSVDGEPVYVQDFGGYSVGYRVARGEDYGGNQVHAEREAPKSRMGLAAPLRGRPVRVAYREPVAVFCQ